MERPDPEPHAPRRGRHRLALAMFRLNGLLLSAGDDRRS